MVKIKPAKLMLALVCAAALAVTAWYFLKPTPQTTQYITAAVSKGDIEDSVLATGVLEATKMVSVGAQVSGQIEKMHFKLGDQVKQGQVIAEIDSVRQENDVETARASIANQQAQLAVKNANLEKVKAEYNRQQAMFAQDATSRAELEAALASYKTAEADIKAIQAQIMQSELTLATAVKNLGYTKIVAPMDGTIVAIVTEEGQTVNANQSAPTIVKLAQLDTMTIKAQISEADVMKVQEGQTVYFTTLGNSEKKHYATLRQVEPAPSSINTESNNSSASSSTAVYYNALFDVPNEDGQLRIDMTAQVYIVLNEARDALTIPAAAVQNSNRPPRPSQAANQARPERPSEERPQGPRPVRLELNAAEKALIDQGQASLAMVRVVPQQNTEQADTGFLSKLFAGDDQAGQQVVMKQVLIGLNNRANAQVLRGLSEGEQVVIADGADTSNDSAKRSSRAGAGGPPMRM